MSREDAQGRPSCCAPDAVADPLLESLEQQGSRHLRGMVALLLAGVLMPVIFGIGCHVIMHLLGLTWTGMDSYVPILLGGAVGVCVGLGFVLAAVWQLLAALRCRRQRARLSD